jgi:DNA-binding MltR family transcriptional regulator
MWLLSTGSKVTSEAIKEFNSQSARTTAIVGAAILDDCLGRLIAARLPTEGETKKQLFKPPSGALSSFDTKIKVAYTMGILSKVAFQDLTEIAKIRNLFAHRLYIADFEHPEVKPLCDKLHLIETHVFSGRVPENTGLRLCMAVPDLEERLSTAKGRYFLSIMLIHGIDVHVPDPDNPKPPSPRALI